MSPKILLLTLIYLISPSFGQLSTSLEPFAEHSDPRDNITAKFNTCDFDLMEEIDVILEEFSDQCKAAYNDAELKNILTLESQLFKQINDKIVAHEQKLDPNCDPFEEGREDPCPKMDWELRLGMHNSTDIMICQNCTEHLEFANCMVDKRNEMLLFVNSNIE